MVQLFKKNFVFIGLIASLPVLFFFQNCAQSGSIGLTDQAVLNGKATTDTLEAVPPKNDIVLDNIPVDTIPIDYRPPGGSTGSGSTGSGTTTPVAPSTHGNGNDTVSHDNPSAGHGESNDASDGNSKGSVGLCNPSAISDVLLSIVSISSNSAKPNQADFEILDADKSVSLEKPTLKLRALLSGSVNQLFMLLSPEGNKILNKDSSVVDFKTPSGQQSGIKIQLANADVVAGRTYVLSLSINPAEQIVTNKVKCLFKPVIKSATLVAQ